MTDSSRLVRMRLEEAAAVHMLLLDADLDVRLDAAAAATVGALRRGGTVLFFGNGGSSSDASHLAGELLGRFRIDRQPLAAIALSDQTAAMTAIGNDYSYDETFERLVVGLGRPGDVAVGISTSGNSRNVVRALGTAREMGLTTIGLTGAGGGEIAGVVEHLLPVQSTDTARIQECHILLGHVFCELVELAMQAEVVAR